MNKIKLYLTTERLKIKAAAIYVSWKVTIHYLKYHGMEFKELRFKSLKGLEATDLADSVS